MGRRHRQRRGSGAAQTGLSGLGLLVPQVPLEDEALAFGVAGDSVAVAAELGVVGRQQLQSGEGALAELVDEAAVSEDAVHLPVGARPAPGTLSRAPGAEVILRALRVVTLDEHSESVHRTEEQSCGPPGTNKSAARTHGEVDSAANGVMRSRTTAPGTASKRAPVRVMSRVRSIKARRVPIGTEFCRSRCISHKLLRHWPHPVSTFADGNDALERRHPPSGYVPRHPSGDPWRRQLSAGNELSVGSRRGCESRVSFIAVSISAGLEAH
jgi:hypothetical protein